MLVSMKRTVSSPGAGFRLWFLGWGILTLECRPNWNKYCSYSYLTFVPIFVKTLLVL